jgi:hypothetical protein
MPVKYRPVVHDGPHTMEQQMLLLADAAARAWKAWCGPGGGEPSPVQGLSEDLDVAMRLLYTQCYQTDVFMGGAHHGESHR